MAGNQNRICLCLRDSGRNGANARTAHQLHTHRRIRVDLLQIINQLRQIFD